MASEPIDVSINLKANTKDFTKSITEATEASGKALEQKLSKAVNAAQTALQQFASTQQKVLASGKLPDGITQGMYKMQESLANASQKFIDTYNKTLSEAGKHTGYTKEFTDLGNRVDAITSDIERGNKAIQEYTAQIHQLQTLQTYRPDQFDFGLASGYETKMKALESQRQTALDAMVDGEDNSRLLAIVDAIDQQIQKLQEAKIAADEYAQAKNALNDANLDVSSPEAIKETFEDITGALEITRDEVQSLEQELNQVVDTMDRMETSDDGGAFVVAGIGDTSVLEKAASDIIATSDSMEQSTDSSYRFNSSLRSLQTSMQSIVRVSATIDKTLTNMFRGFFGAISSCINAFKRLRSSMDKTVQQNQKGFKKLLMTTLKYTLGVRSLYFLFRKLRTAVKNAFKEMAKQIPEVNKDISSILQNFNGVKATLGTMFQPLLAAFTPIINTILSKLQEAMEAIGKFFAVLTGQDYIYKAIATNVDYAASLDKTSKAAKDANKQLAGFDKINNLTTKDDSSSGKDSGIAKYVKQAVAESFWADLLKKCLEKDDFTELGRTLAEKITDVLNGINWNTIKARANKFAKYFAQTINGLVSVKELANAIGRTIAEALNTAFGALKTFATTVNWGDVGLFIHDGIVSFLENANTFEWGSAVGNMVRGLITAFYTTVSDPKMWSSLGTKISDAINGALASMSELRDVKVGTDIDLQGNEVDVFESMTGWQALGKGASNLAKGILEALIKAIKGIEWDEVGAAIGEMIGSIDWAGVIIDFGALCKAIVDGLGEALDKWEEVDPVSAGIAKVIGIAFLGTKLVGFISIVSKIVTKIIAIFSKLKGFFGSTFGGILTFVSGAIMAFTNFFDMLKNGFSWIKTILMWIGAAIAAVGAVILGAPAAVAAIVAAIGAAIMTLIVVIKDHWTEICEWFAGVWSAVCEFFEGLGEWFAEIWEKIKEKASSIWTAIAEFFTNLWSSIKEKASNIWGSVTSFFSNTFNKIKTTASNVWTKIKDTVVNAATNIKTKVSNTFTTLKTTVLNILNNLKEGFKKPINGILGFINGMISGVVDGLNNMIRAINKLEFTLPDWVPFVGGKSLGFTIPELTAPQIPLLAQGAVLPANKPFLAMVGDQKNGTNIEAPLTTIEQALRNVLNQQNINVTFQVEGDPNGLFKVTQQQANMYSRRTGRPAFT